MGPVVDRIAPLHSRTSLTSADGGPDTQYREVLTRYEAHGGHMKAAVEDLN